MLSRTADHLFWMSRYMERAGHVAQQHGARLTTARQRLLCQDQNTRRTQCGSGVRRAKRLGA